MMGKGPGGGARALIFRGVGVSLSGAGALPSGAVSASADPAVQRREGFLAKR
jgi:hypothetical protein